MKNLILSALTVITLAIANSAQAREVEQCSLRTASEMNAFHFYQDGSVMKGSGVEGSLAEVEMQKMDRTSHVFDAFGRVLLSESRRTLQTVMEIQGCGDVVLERYCSQPTGQITRCATFCVLTNVDPASSCAGR